MEPLQFKVLLLLANIWASYAASRDPSNKRPPASSERLTVSGFEHITNLVVFLSRAVILLFPVCEILAILSLYNEPGSPFGQVVGITFPAANTSHIRLTPTFIAISLTALFGAILRWQCCVILGHYFSLNLTIRSKQKLITHGPYAFVRHPSYTGAILMVFGTTACQMIEGSWLTECTVFHEPILRTFTIAMLSLVWFTWVFRRMDTEDEMLKKAFGKEWEAWEESVPYRLVPGIY